MQDGNSWEVILGSANEIAYPDNTFQKNNTWLIFFLLLVNYMLCFDLAINHELGMSGREKEFIYFPA